MNTQRLSALSDWMKRAVDRGECAGVQAAVVKDGREVWHAAVGLADVAGNRPMGRDTLFRMFSSTKCVTGLAAAMCVDRGLFSLRTPVYEFLPGFRNQCWWDGEKTREIGPGGRPVHLFDLMNMTSGVTYVGDWDAGDRGRTKLIREQQAEIDRGVFTGTVELMNRMGGVPLSFAPGTRWAYGFNADVAAAVIEVATGKRYGQWLREEIFEPLGMDETGFTVTPERRARLATCYRCVPGEAGCPRAMPDVGRRLGLADYVPETGFESGGAGLVSTVGDWCKLMAMLQAGGTWGGHRFLSPAGFRLMTTPMLTPEQARTFNWQDFPGHNYAFFNHVKVAGAPSSNPCNPGTFGWDGALGTNSFVDPVEKLSLVVTIQNEPPFTTSNLTWGLRNPLYAALD
ncbi:MAG: beta-lactamase family protein [Kiritimatiellae bacterium]|nr:beta-lactamase family protein [Kiritimatiellia bacterium]